jgi:signal transduction histidine kinase
MYNNLMDDLTVASSTPPALPTTASPLPEPVQTQTPAADELTNELAHVTREMYKKNLEMAEKNKTLSLLRKIDEIILGSVVSGTDAKAAVIFLLDKRYGMLSRLALSQTDDIIKAEQAFGKKYHGERHMPTQTTNLLYKAVIERKMQITEHLFDVLLPSFTQEEAAKIQEMLGVTKTLVYPLIVRNEVLGVMSIDIGEKDAVMSEYQKDLIDRLAIVVGIAIDNALMYQRIQSANERLKEVDKMKDEFVSLASHELRTPMTAIKSYIWMLVENNMIQDAKGKEYLHHAYEATDRLINLVNDMLNVSRIESGRMVITLVPTDLPKVVQEIIAEVKPAADKQQIRIETNAESVTLPQVQADVNKIKQVFINLIGNSIKFTSAGGKITVTLKSENDLVIVKVSDTGTGIQAEDIPKLFVKFGLIEKNYLNKSLSQGTGLGLYISKSIIELHGGKIGVESRGVNQGTTFTFTLRPVTTAQVTQPAALSTHRTAP